ncbi:MULTISPECIES: ABC transporter ATP-binding protein [unclassified Herbaspirillum]|uniref:ABC transporter ATP-binding protein n=1 Tax=unclassified Herbaspirillum TaxID=2624150 RepID=UPI001150ACFE|nr:MULTISPECIES: ABC transporter ATP-binding protein [unclassified Herbaspirillum]MBB5390278.1 branched-chain amino acid transport system ATP-binding protein [Herbaspirillum sp. SJZ102]TQK09224.1 amino acid/amide ABC transporter ATP-binding protein 2 (HAAT family) [Herbaspirillum sp. SJZ130]TQK14089.1 amino acid/amide ABC transporter ATP-binding protein 2 (HAAT family) [Herbaspirillum sp. SJZ106]
MSAQPNHEPQPLVLETRGLVVGYGGRPVLRDFDFGLRPAEVLCLIGHNGAGKSTLLKTLFGLVQRQDGQILLDGRALDAVEPRRLTAAGISLVPEGRGIFPGLTVAETMKMGLWSAGVPAGERAARLDWVMSVLPALKQFYERRAGNLSGGQQQMVSIGRALLSRPRCLLMDEPSIGLAPKLFQDLLQPIRELQRTKEGGGMAILLVEQNVKEALKISDRVVVMKSGAIIREALPEELNDNAKLMELY